MCTLHVQWNFIVAAVIFYLTERTPVMFIQYSIPPSYYTPVKANTFGVLVYKLSTISNSILIGK